MKRRSWRLTFALLLILLLAFALRVYDLDGQSMWSDEGLSLYRAQQSIADIFDNVIVVDGVATRDTNPALYFLLLHGWRALAGESVFVLRYGGIMGALFAVPLIYLLGRAAFSPRTGLFVALLLALSPFHVWQAQVLRNYGLLLTWNLLAVFALFRFLFGGRQGRWLILWLFASLAGVYTHYFGFFILAFGLLALAVVVVRGGIGRSRAFWWLLLAAVALLPALALALARFQVGRQVDFDPVELGSFIDNATAAFSVGMSPYLTHPAWRVLPVVALALIGVGRAWRRRPGATWFLLGYQFVPFAILLALSAINPLYNGTRHLLIGLPPFLLFLGVGAVGPTGRLGTAAQRLALSLGLLVLVSQTAWLFAQFHSPELVRDDVRGAARYLSEVATADDVVVLHDTLIRFTFDHYYDGEAPVVAIPAFSQSSPEEAAAALAATGAAAERVWFLHEPTPRTGFPRTFLTSWADDHWSLVAERRFPRMWLSVGARAYAPELAIATLPAEAAPHRASWPGVLNLHGVDLPSPLPAGGEWWPTFYLSLPAPPDDLYSLSLRLVDDTGTVWAQLDRPLGASAETAVRWPTDTPLQYAHPLTVPAGVPPGEYELRLRLQRSDGGTIPLASDAVETTLGAVTVAGAPCDAPARALPPLAERSVGVGPDLTLRGVDVPAAEYRPGHALSVDALWCVAEPAAAASGLRLELVDGNNEVIAAAEAPLADVAAQPGTLAPDTLLLSKTSLLVPGATEPGAYRLRLSAFAPDGAGPLRVSWPPLARSLTLGEVEIVPWPLRTEFPPIETPLQAAFGQPPQIELRGYELTPAAPGAVTELTLFWRAVEAPDTNYHVFVHLTAEDGTIAAQDDGPPDRGFRPTSSWRPGEAIVDARTMSLPPDLPPGRYALYVGLYNPADEARLPVSGAGADGDRLLLQAVEVTP